MSNPRNRNKTKNKKSQGPPTTSNRVERATFTHGKIAVTLEIIFNDNYLDLIINKKEKIFYVLMQFTFYQKLEWYEKVQYKIQKLKAPKSLKNNLILEKL